MADFIPVNVPRLEGREKDYLLECIETGWISSEGPFVRRFESAMAESHGRRHAVAVSSGSAALDIAVAALGLGEGDEVIMPAFTIISCASAVVRAGATPVLVDCDARTWNMDAPAIEARITPRTRAIMAVHIYGLPVDMDPVVDLANRHGLAVIEDAAEAIGLQCRGKLCGSFGDLAVFSFYANKHITTGEGGMLLTDDDTLADQARELRNLCFKPGRRFVHERLGWNYRMTNVQAALGLAQWESLDSTVQRKRTIGAAYERLLGGLQGVQLPLASTAYAENIYWVYGLVLGDELSLDAEAMISELAERGIGARPFFWPMHEQPVFRRMGLFEGERYPVSENLARRGFYLPSGLALEPEQIKHVAEVVRSIIR